MFTYTAQLASKLANSHYPARAIIHFSQLMMTLTDIFGQRRQIRSVDSKLESRLELTHRKAYP
jgi:hypothetical protein